MTMNEGVSQSSVEVKMTAKGEAQVAVKIYQTPGGTLDLPAETVKALQRTHAELANAGYKAVAS